jgi:ribose 5-phosphate isomerase B
MKISLGADHGGVDLKNGLVQALREAGYEILDRGTDGHASVDYPDYAILVAEDVAQGRADRGVLVCTTGIGMCISANKIHGARAALCFNEDSAEFCRRHNDANVICFGQKYITPYMAMKLATIFLGTEFEGGRHQRRVAKMTAEETAG